jgi:tetratricopeptide (TPR) repeat protein
VQALEQALTLDASHTGAELLLAELTGGARADLRRASAAASPAPQGPQAVRALTWVYGSAAGDDGESSVGGLFDAISAWVVGRPAVAATWVSALPDVEEGALGAALTYTAAADGADAAAARAACDGLQSASPGGEAAAHVALMCGNPTAALRALEGAGSISAAQTAVHIAETLGGPALTAAVAALEALTQPAAVVVEATDGAEGEAAAEAPVASPASASHPAALCAARAKLRAARGDHAATAAGHLVLAELEPSAQVRAAHARRAAQLFTALGRTSEATTGLKLAVVAFRELGDGHAEAWEALAEAQRAAGDAAAAVETLSEAPLPEAERARVVAELTTRADLPGRADAWELAAAAAGLYERLGHEVALAHEARWAELFDAWSGRHEATASAEERAVLERSRRGLLADKLAETDLAIELYERLHAESPDDREVLENLARVAGARGETDRSIAWLEELAESAATPIDAARYHRRIAETWIRANDDAYARQAFLNALDFQPDDQAALAGLEALAAKAEDWDALRSVLQRKASICPPAERKDVLRQIARLVDERFTDRGEALDAWRAVTEVDPQDSEALWRMLNLADAAGEHDAMLEIGNQLEARLEGGERSKLLSRLGAVCEDLGRRDDAIHYFEQAVAAEEPDPNASVRLEGLYRAGQDHAGVVRAILAQASLASDDEVRVERMLTAARIEQEMRHDREAASRLFEEILRVDPAQADALRMHADWLWDTGRGEDASPLFERLSPVIDELTPESDAAARLDGAAFYFRHGDVLRVSGRRDEAISRYLAALALHPHHLPSLEAAGPLLVDAERWTEAGDVWTRVAAITAGSSDLARSAHVITQIARVDAALGETDRAWAGFNRALMLHPNDVAALRGLANILEGRRDWNALLTVYNNIIYHATLPGDVIAAYMTKGRVLDENLDRQDKAVQHYERSLAFEARQPAAYLRLAELALRRDAAEDAVTYASRGLDVAEAGPMKADLHIARALGLLATDYGAAAEAEIGLAIEVDPSRAALLGASPLSDPTAVRASLRSRLPR